MAFTVSPDDDVVSLPPTEWNDLTGAEDALARLARVSGGGGAQSKSSQSKSFADSTSRGPLADATLFVEAGKARPRRVARAFLRYLIAVCFGVAATLAWQRHGELAQQTVARWIPQLVWLDSPAVHASVPEPVVRQAMSAEPAVAELLTPPAPPAPPVAAPSVAAPPVAPPPSGVTTGDLADLRRTVERMAASQEQMAREISTLRAVRQEARPKIAAPVAPQSVAVLPPPPPPQRLVPAPPLD
jgi:hypothetical protein